MFKPESGREREIHSVSLISATEADHWCALKVNERVIAVVSGVGQFEAGQADALHSVHNRLAREFNVFPQLEFVPLDDFKKQFCANV